MSDPISRLLADAWVGKHSTGAKEETADELGMRLVKEARTKALDRALGDLSRGHEPRQSDLDVFNGDPRMNLQYLDARDEAVARYGGDLVWQPDAPDLDDEGEKE
ncbi:hypothetical protein MB02_05270 [Croceicoccus estronivorus]|uniref:hypothetical protein n=1 Tax=Croceicoccus estronivorus TaxID=1172626 RepID=UPI00082BE598|nr:hypothetical protein [Croceicoccus estronivorus]OCC24870.1 hypothetical protein MB02_05270 [Croceicoccus estronivorus]